MTGRRRRYGVVPLPLGTGDPAAAGKRTFTTLLEQDFRPMAFWVWAGPGCTVLDLQIGLTPLFDPAAPAPAVEFPAPVQWETLRLALLNPSEDFSARFAAPLELERKAAIAFFEESHHAFSDGFERFPRGSFARLDITGGPFEAAVIFGDWWSE